MEIIPGEGVELARLGETRVAVESRVGAPVHGPGGVRAVYDTTPALVISYTSADRVEIVELAYSGEGREEVFFDGVQLTYRFLDEVVAELNDERRIVEGVSVAPYDYFYQAIDKSD
jgi:hypothetical protein